MPIDLRSDTITLPTDGMREAMYKAELGDDVIKEDPTVNELQEYSAALLGKEAALFMPSGTMANLTAIMSHTKERGCEIIAGAGSHIFLNEAGGYAHIAGVSIRTINDTEGFLNQNEMLSAIRDPDNIHHPRTKLICMENTHNTCGGTVIPLEKLRQLTAQTNIPCHLDGARIFNAAAYLDVQPSSISVFFDSVMFCLSKGLCAPVGSVLTGSREFIDTAVRIRKMLGGGMRQAGVLAAAGLVALKTMRQRLVSDHETARMIAEGICDIKGISLDLETVQTNMVRFSVDNASVFNEKLKEHGLLAYAIGSRYIRLVTHRHIDKKSAREAISIIAAAARGL